MMLLGFGTMMSLVQATHNGDSFVFPKIRLKTI